MTLGTYPDELRAFLDDIRTELRANVVTVSLPGDEVSQTLAASAPAGIALPDTDGPLAQAIVRHVARMNFPLVVSDTISHPLLSDVPGIRHSVSGACLGYPVREDDGRVVAVLAAMRDRIHEWTRAEQDIMAEAARGVRRYLGT